MSERQKITEKRRRGAWDTAILLSLFLGLLLVCLPGWTQEEDEEEGEFQGLGLHIKLKGAWVAFAGGDMDKGPSGYYDRQIVEILSAGFELRKNDKNPFRNGYELSADLVYYLTPRIGLGVGGSLVRSHQESTALFHWPESTNEYRLTGLPEIRVISIRLGLFYLVPINRLLALSLSAGPEYHIADFKYSGSLTSPYYAGSLVQRADTRKLGLYGGIALEMRMNRRLAFCLEALGRYARISGFEGNEAAYEWGGGQSITTQHQGSLYYTEDGGFPHLDIPASVASGGQNARKAVFDFSGVSLRAGLNFKF
jgi:hypothetical protein